MQKIISLFRRNYDTDRLVRDEVVPGAEWVIRGEGIATEKIDGTACLIDEEGLFYKRYDGKEGRTPPPGWIPTEEAPDPNTGHWPGWVPVKLDGVFAPEDRWHVEAYCITFLDPALLELGYFPPTPGTYELVGPKVQNNPYGLTHHELWKHGSHWFREPQPPRTFDELKAWFETHNVEGIVWHHQGMRMVKIKKKDFGLKWPKPPMKNEFSVST